MPKKNLKSLIIDNIVILIPFIFYAIYKNGYLVYTRNLISLPLVFKPLYLILIALFIKIVVDLISLRKILINYDLLYLILIAMIMPWNINLIVYSLVLGITYPLFRYLDKYLKVNKVCLIYGILVLINALIGKFSYLNPLEAKYSFSFTFLDLLIGRNIGGISITNILFSLIAYYYLTFNFYYKKNIPLAINFSYLLCAFLYFIVTSNSNFLINSDLIFASIFICPLPKYSPYKVSNQIIYGVFIGICSFIIAILFNSSIAIYLAVLLVSCFSLIDLKKVLKLFKKN